MKKAALFLFLVVFTLFGLTGCDIIMGILGISFGTVDLTVSVSVSNNNSVFITITNNGDEPAINVPYSVVLSATTAIDSSKPKVFEGFSDVYAGESDNISIPFNNFNLANIVGGQYHIGVIVDPYNDFDEEIETNNKAVTLNTYFFGSGPPPASTFTINVTYQGNDVVDSSSPLIVAVVNLDATNPMSPDTLAFQTITSGTATAVISQADIQITTNNGYGVFFLHDLTNSYQTDGNAAPGPRGWYKLGAGGNIIYTGDWSNADRMGPGDTIDVTFQPPADMYEVDNVAAQATLMYPGETQTHNISPMDEDWVMFYAAPGATYTVETSYPGAGNVVDTKLYIFDGDEIQLFYNDNISTADNYSSITFAATYSGIHYIKVTGSDFSSFGAYNLDIYYESLNTSPLWVDLNTTLPATISAAGELDWYTVDVVAGGEYTFETFEVTGGVVTDTVMQVFDDNMRFIGMNDDKVPDLDYYSAFVYTPTYTYDHAVYILVYEYGQNNTGDYEFFVTANGTISVTVQ